MPIEPQTTYTDTHSHMFTQIHTHTSIHIPSTRGVVTTVFTMRMSWKFNMDVSWQKIVGEMVVKQCKGFYGENRDYLTRPEENEKVTRKTKRRMPVE